MGFVVLCLVFVILEANCAPTEAENEAVTEENGLENEDQIEKNPGLEARQSEDTPQANKDKNPVQEWFENLSKNASTSAQNTMDTLKQWFSQLTQNSNGASNTNLPTMYVGSFQLLKMPMPQFSDVIKGMGNLATAAESFNKLTGGLTQGIPLIPQG